MSGGRQLIASFAGPVAVFGGAVYILWRGGQVGELGVMAGVFFVAELVNYLALVAAVVALWAPHRRPPPGPPPPGSVDVFIPVCGEDASLVEATLRAALAIDHPHETVVLNDGRIGGYENWGEIEALCRHYDVRCLTRTGGPPGKAGNLNRALRQTSGDFIVCLDADHVARPELCEMLLGYFEDPGVAFVASRQCFALDGEDALGHQEALFYGSIQPAKDRDNAAFSCGSGVAYRREAIESLGGFSEWNLVEDLHTSYELHARGWRSVYVAEPVSVGTAPSTAAEMASQRLRWATDSLRMLFFDNPLRKPGLSWRQRLHYLQTTGWYVVAAAHVVFLVSPIASILAGVPLLVPGAEGTYMLLLALYLGSVAVLLCAHVGLRAALRTAQVQTFLSPVFALAVARALLSRGGLRAGVTRKSGQRQMSWLTLFQHAALGMLLLSAGVSIARPGQASWVVVLWACVLTTALATPGSMLGLRRDAAQSLRIAITAPAVLAATLVALSVASGSGVRAATGSADDVAPAPSRVLAPPARGVYLGAYHRSLAGPPSRPLSIQRYGGAKLRIIHRFQAWWGSDRFLSMQWLDAVARKRGVPMISWEPLEATAAGLATTQPDGVATAIAAGRHDPYVRTWARDAAAYRRPLVIRLMHEMNGGWYPWAAQGRGNSPAAFKAAWRRIVGIFRKEGASNVTWVFSLAALGGGVPTPMRTLQQYYPGPRYVDWVGLSGFNWMQRRFAGFASYSRIFGPSYEVVKRLRKPIIFSEIGIATAAGSRAPAWVHDVMTTLPRRFPRVRALVWFDAPHPQRDFTLRGRALRQLRIEARRPSLRPPLRWRTR